MRIRAKEPQSRRAFASNQSSERRGGEIWRPVAFCDLEYRPGAIYMAALESLLESHPNCPLCGGSSRAIAGYEVRSPGYYVEILISQFGLDRMAFDRALNLFRCAGCGTLWYDPWLTPRVSSSLYGYLCGRHKFGWASLRAWLVGLERPYFRARPELWGILGALVPNMTDYGEVNCPYGGLFFHLFDAMAGDVNREALARKIPLLSQMYAGEKLVGQYGEAGAFSGLIDDMRAVRENATAPRTFLVREFSDMCWGHSCIFNGNHCLAFAQDVLVDEVVDFDTLRATGQRLGALGLFNVWDHFRDPMRVLSKATDVADLVVIDLHHYGWTDAQHFFNVGDRVIEFLHDRGFNAVDLTPHIKSVVGEDDDRRYLLVSKVLELGMALEETGLAIESPDPTAYV